MCAASTLLPQYESHNEYADSGTNDHALVANVMLGVPGATVIMDAKRPGLWDAVEQRLRDVENISAEPAYVVDMKTKTSVFLGLNINRKYREKLGRDFRPYEMGVSLDIYGRRGEELEPWIRDLKFGTYHSWWQLYVQAMAVLWTEDRTAEDVSVDAGFLFMEERDEHWFAREESATIYAMDLDDRADELVAAMRKAEAMLSAGLDPYTTEGLHSLPVNEGKWCQYCPAFNSCPAKWKLAKSMLDMPDVATSVAALTSQQCGAAWLKLSEIKRNIIEKTEKALKHRMREEGGFVLESGKVLRLIEQRGRLGFDREGAIELLRQRGVSESEIAGLMKRGDSYESVRTTNADKE